jgi:type II secretory pathway pseudopilin PulG
MTLIELMAVMGIMVVIVSAIVIAAYGVQRQGQIKGTEGVMEQIVLGLSNFRAANREYVPQSNGTFDFTDDALVEATTRPLWTALEYEGDYLQQVPGANKAVGGTISSLTPGPLENWYFYQDAWRRPLLYVCQSDAQGLYSHFTLTSAGPDLVFGTGDDIVRE